MTTASLSKPPRGFVTPQWAVRALIPHIGHLKLVLEPAAGTGGISRELEFNGTQVHSFDLYPQDDANRRDFLSSRWDEKYKAIRERMKQSDGGIVSHPPHYLAEKFIKQSLKLTSPYGTTALWLKDRIDQDYDLRDLFARSKTFYKKIVPIQTFRLSDDSQEPMAWYLWRGGYGGAPQLHYEIV